MGHRSTIDTAIRAAFGVSYPITYELAIPGGSSGLVAQYRYRSTDFWTTLPAPSADGEPCARMDYAANRAWVTVGFDPATDHNTVDVRVIHAATGAEVATTFQGIAKYYDNRAAAVSVSWDDVDGRWIPEFVPAVEACQARGLWCSVGINAGGVIHLGGNPIGAAQWPTIQGWVNDGYVEPANHGYTHKNPQVGNWDDTVAATEVDMNADAILGALTMPWQSRMGDLQYVLAWIEPNGATNNFVQARLAGAGLICQRNSNYNAPPAGVITNYAPWNPTYGVYDPTYVSLNSEDVETAATMNSYFDAALAANGMYLMYGHPWLTPENHDIWPAGGLGYDWEPDDRIYDHLDHISARSNCWYVPWGHLYAYRHAALNAVVTTQTTTTGARIRLGGANRNVARLSRPLVGIEPPG